MLDVFGLFSVETLYVLIGIIALLVIAIVLSIVAIAKSSSMKKKYNKMMEGSDGKSIEQIIKEYTDDVKLLKSTYEDAKENLELFESSEDNTAAIKDIYEKLQYTFQKIGIVKYDAFHEMGGKLSFALCMLDNNNNGYLVNVMHSNNGCFAYVKEIINGESFIELGGEEEKALKQAVAGRMGDEELSQEVNDIVNNVNQK